MFFQVEPYNSIFTPTDLGNLLYELKQIVKKNVESDRVIEKHRYKMMRRCSQPWGVKYLAN